MDFLWSLFSPRRQYRHYARLDQAGICRAFKQCSQAPEGQGWVQITEQQLAWLGQPLPASARMTRAAKPSGGRRLQMA